MGVATSSLADRLLALGMDDDQVMRIYRTFNAASEPFRRESERHEAPQPEEVGS